MKGNIAQSKYKVRSDYGSLCGDDVQRNVDVEYTDETSRAFLWSCRHGLHVGHANIACSRGVQLAQTYGSVLENQP